MIVNLPVVMPKLAIRGYGLISTPDFLLLLLAVAAITGLLYLEHPPINRRSILALVPWMIAAATIPILTQLADYPPATQQLFGSLGSYLSTYVILGAAWFTMLELSVGNDTKEVLSDYLGAMGIGLSMILVTLVLLHGTPSSINQLGWSVIILFGVAIFSVIVVFTLGFWYVDAPTHTGAVGMLAVFGQTLDGVARSVGIGVFDIGSHSFLSWKILDLVATVQVQASGSEQLLSWTLTYVWIKIALAIFAVIFLAQYSKDQPQRGYLALGVIAAIGLISGISTILLISIGGVP